MTMAKAVLGIGLLLAVTSSGCASGGRPGFEAYSAKPAETVATCVTSAWGAETGGRASFLVGGDATEVELRAEGSQEMMARAEVRRGGGVRMWSEPAIAGALAERLRVALVRCL